MKVCKFGGTSVASAEQIKKVVNIIKSDASRKIIVVSAPWKRFPDDEKVTDLLINLAETALANKNIETALEDVVQRYHLIAEGLGLNHTITQIIETDLRNRLANKSNDVSLFID